MCCIMKKGIFKNTFCLNLWWVFHHHCSLHGQWSFNFYILPLKIVEFCFMITGNGTYKISPSLLFSFQIEFPPGVFDSTQGCFWNWKINLRWTPNTAISAVNKKTGKCNSNYFDGFLRMSDAVRVLLLITEGRIDWKHEESHILWEKKSKFYVLIGGLMTQD